MLLIELFTTEAGVGIITKQNTTPDVKPGETQRQAAKLGMKLDKKNRPPLLHKSAAKNTSANKAYNLGLVTEVQAVEPDESGYQHDLLTFPQRALVIDTPGDLDWYKIGQHYPNLDTEDPHEYGQSDSDMVIIPSSEKELEKLKRDLDRLGLRWKEIGGSVEQPEIHIESKKQLNKVHNLINEGRELYDGKLPIVSLITALALALSTPQVSADETTKDAYELARKIYKAKDMTRAGAEEEAKQEIKNILRAIQGHPNQSKVLDIFKKSMKEDIEQLDEHIRKEGNKYTVYSKNGKRKFGTYTSKADAEKRLRQIEMFKHMG